MQYLNHFKDIKPPVIDNNMTIPSLPWLCSFGPSIADHTYCGMERHDNGVYRFDIFESGTPTGNTGPDSRQTHQGDCAVLHCCFKFRFRVYSVLFHCRCLLVR